FGKVARVRERQSLQRRRVLCDYRSRRVLWHFFRRFLGAFDGCGLGHTHALPLGFRLDVSAESQSLELAAAAPRIDILEVGQCAGGVADIEPRCGTRLASHVIVITWG